MEMPYGHGIMHKMHTFFGKSGWGKSEKNCKRKMTISCFTKKPSNLSHVENMVGSVNSQSNLLPVGWDKELLERLQPGKKTANHKRVLSLHNIQLAFTQLQFPTIRHNHQEEFHREQRVQSEGPLTKACARQRRQQYQTNRAYLTVEHDESEMSRRSPGDRKHRHSLTKVEVVDLSNDSELPLGPEEKGKDSDGSDDSLEIEGVPRVLNARRVPPGSGPKPREIISTPEPSLPTKSVSSGNAGRLRSGRLQGVEEIIISAASNALEQTVSDTSKGPNKKEWDYFNSYKDRRPSSVRDYGNPSAAAPVPVPTASSEEEPMAPIPSGGPKPVNRLSSHAPRPNLNPPFKPPKQRISPEKFDSFENKLRSNNTHPNKRQKTEGTPVSRNGSAISPIDLDDEPTEKKKQTGTSTTRFAQSQTKNTNRFEVEEYGSVEKMMNPSQRKQKSNSSDNQSLHERGGGQFLDNGSVKRTSLHSGDTHYMEDENDPISDFEVMESNPTLKRKPQVVIERRRYEGTAFRKPPRLQPNDEMGKSSSTAASRTHEALTHFQGPQILQQGRNSNSSHHTEDTSPDGASTKLLDPLNGSQNTRKALFRDAIPLFDPDNSLDEISAEHFETAHNLRTGKINLRGQKPPREPSNKTIEKNSRRQSFQSEESTDDEIIRRAGDIQPVKFASLKGARGKTVSNDERYDARLVFSETDMWLVESSKGPWPLIHDPTSKTLKLLDGSNRSRWILPTTKVKKIDYCTGSEILVIHKDRDYTAGSGTHIYIQLRDADQSNDLRESLKASQPTMQTLQKTAETLGKVLSNSLDKLLSNQTRLASKKRRSPIEEEEQLEIQLAKKRMEKRLEPKWDSRQDSMRSVSQLDHKRTREDGTNERPKGLARAMRTRSNSGHFEDEGLRQLFKIPEVLSSDFYGSSNSGRPNLGSAHETRSSTRASERDRKPRQQRPRSPSPPLGWTTLNPDWAKEWHSPVIYPAEGNGKARVDKARVDMGDIKKLDEGEFLNDNLIIFYLRWLQNQLEQEHPDWAKRIFFQNTFFYERLTSPEKGSKGINYAAVERWTAKVNLLDYDYIIIPVNEHLHWYVAIICNASKLLPGAEMADHFQLQGDTEAFEEQQINPEALTRTISTSVASTKQNSEVSNDTEVDVVTKAMSLDSEKLEDTEDSEWPNDNIDPAPMHRGLISVSHNCSRGNYAVERGSPEPATLTSDIAVSATSKTSQTKRSKRKSMPALRKYNPKEFRIITLDSLGTSHSAACANLKDYLVQEIKAKLNIDIPRPGSIGTTAKHIPLQTNFYDCGLFLLSYIEMFLQNPDEFISGILQHGLDKMDVQWPKVSEMRARIRDILFDLQREQVAAAERLGTGKGKGKGKGRGKRVPKTEGKTDSAPSAMSSSREASRSARPSPDRRILDESRTAEEKRIRTQVEVSTKTGLSESRKSAFAELRDSSEPSRLNDVSRKELPTRDDMRVPGASSTTQVHDLNADSQHSGKASGNRFNNFLSNVTMKVSEYFIHDRPRVVTASKPKSSGTHVIEIQDSPPKADSVKVHRRPRDPEMQTSSRTFVDDKNDSLENGSSTVEYVEKPELSKQQQQRGAKSFRQTSARHGRLILASPTPDDMEPPDGTPGGHDAQDLRSPGPDDIEPLHEIQTSLRISNSEGAMASPHAAEDRGRAIRAPSPDVMLIPSLDVRDRRTTPYSANGVEDEDEFQGFPQEIGDSAGEEEGEEVDFIDPEPGLKGLSKVVTEASASDAEMLLQSKGSQQKAIEIMSEDETAEDADPSLLTESSTGKSLPSSPAQPHQDIGKAADTSPSKGRKRKGIGESGDWQHHARPRPVMRDASDRAIMGKHVRTYISFDD